MKFDFCIHILLELLSFVHTSWAYHERRQASTNSTQLLTDITAIQNLWGELRPYDDNPDDYFGVKPVGLPDGCQVEQVHTLQRHGARFPTGGSEGTRNENFGAKVLNWTTTNATQKFTGPLAFLNGYKYQLGEDYLVALGGSQLFRSGLDFWRQYGRILYNQSTAALAYNGTYANGTTRPKPVLRTTSQSRIWNSEINWALGFFGPSFRKEPDPTIANFTDQYNLVVITEGGVENNTLASYDSCTNDGDPIGGYLGTLAVPRWIAKYLPTATARLQQYAPPGFTLTVNDTYAMQDICAYETNYYGSSDFCTLFTLDEWNGFEIAHDVEYFYDYGYGNPTGRAQGIGYVQELIARLRNQYIPSSNSSVNSTLDDNGTTFPLGQPFYADFSHDDIIVSVLTALSVDYFNDAPSITTYPVNATARRFLLSHLTPFAARLTTEVIGCGSANPTAQMTSRLSYTPGQYGYSPTNATYKFIRMRLNRGIVPLASIRGGACSGRTDGMCSMENFMKSQDGAEGLANYQYACFGNYTGVLGPNDLFDYDGTINATWVAGKRGNGTGTG